MKGWLVGQMRVLLLLSLSRRLIIVFEIKSRNTREEKDAKNIENKRETYREWGFSCFFFPFSPISCFTSSFLLSSLFFLSFSFFLTSLSLSLFHLLSFYVSLILFLRFPFLSHYFFPFLFARSFSFSLARVIASSLSLLPFYILRKFFPFSAPPAEYFART